MSTDSQHQAENAGRLKKPPKLKRTSFTMTEEQAELIERMRKYHLAGSVSEYLTGLVMLDALMFSGKAVPRTIPHAWTLRSYPLIFIRDARAMLLKARKAVVQTGQKFSEMIAKDGTLNLTDKDTPSFMD